jgi:hypothetical protein
VTFVPSFIVITSGISLRTVSASTLTANPGTGCGTLRLMSVSAGGGVAAGRFTGQPLFTTTSVVRDRAIYDHTTINLTSINRVRDRSLTGSVNLDQIFLNT